MALLNQYDVERYIQATAARGDLSVVWEKETKPRTDGKKVYLPKITAETTPEMAEELMAFVTHEVSHNKYTNFKTWNDHAVSPDKSFLGFIANGLEDDNVDWINCQEYRGDKHLISNVFGSRVDEMTDHLKNLVKESNSGKMDPEQKKKIDDVSSFYTWYTKARDDLILGVGRKADELKDVLEGEPRERAEKLRKGNYEAELRKLREDTSPNRTQRVYDLAKRIFEEVYEEDPEKEEQRCKQEQKDGEGEGEGAEGSKPGSGKPGSGKDGKGQKGEGKGSGRRVGKGDPSDDERTEFEECDYDELSMDFQPLRVNRGYGAGQHLDYDKWKPTRNAYTPTPLKDTIVVDYKAKKSNHGSIRPDARDGGIAEYTDAYQSVAGDHSGEGFVQKVRMLLQIRSRGRTQYGTKHGKLHSGNLYRVTIPNAGAYSQHVFKKRILSDVLDTSVCVLGDTSGSMRGDKYVHTMVAAVHLSNTLGNTLHIPTEILGFTEHECRNTMFIHRDYNTKLLSEEELVRRFAHAGQFMSQNCDGDSVLFAYHRLLAQPTKRKVLIVLSDGSPASSKGGDIYSYTCDIVKSIEADKRVDIIGVGLMDKNVERIYKSHEFIRSAGEIEGALLKLIEKKIAL